MPRSRGWASFSSPSVRCAAAQESLPFPPGPSASIAGRTMQESTMAWRRAPGRLKNPPNILIIMFDDAGFAQADTFGGEIHTPTLSRLAADGISAGDASRSGAGTAGRSGG